MKYQRSQPYQPFLLRLLHGLTGLFALLALATAFWTYNTYDGRWGRIPLPDFPDIEGIHGTFGLWTLLIFPLFIIYAFHRGKKRLIQANSWLQFREIDRPIGLYQLHRLINTLALFALTFALFSGKMMDENWLPQGELNHGWYFVHLLSWLFMVLLILCHVLMSIKVGGFPLILSMLKGKYRAKDSPFLWWNQVINFKGNWQEILKQEWLALPIIFKILEISLLGILILAWGISALK